MSIWIEKKQKNSTSKEDIGLFTREKDILNLPEKNKLKNLFNKSQNNGGIMWHDIISFDNNLVKEPFLLN